MSRLLYDRQRAAISDLLKLFEERRRVESDLVARLDVAEQEAREAGETALQKLTARREQELAASEAAIKKDHKEVVAQHQAMKEAEEKAFAESLRLLANEETVTREKMRTSLQDAVWAADSLLEAGLKRVQQKQDSLEQNVAEILRTREALWERFEPLLKRVGLKRADVEPRGEVPPAEGDTQEELQELIERSEAILDIAENLRVRRWLQKPTQFGVMLLSVGLSVIPSLIFQPWWLWLAAGLPLGIAVAVIQRKVLFGLLYRKNRYAGRAMLVLMAQAEQLSRELVERGKEEARGKRGDLQEQHRTNREKAEGRYRPQLEQLEQRIAARRQAIEEKHKADQERMRQEGMQSLEQLKQRARQEKADCHRRHDEAALQSKKETLERMERLRRERVEALRQMQIGWNNGCKRFLAEREVLLQAKANGGHTTSANGEEGSSRVEGLPIGSLTLDLAPFLDNLPRTSLEPLPESPLDLPAFLPFPRQGTFLLQTYGNGRTVAVQSLQAMMLRFLTSLPPGKVRFIILDPVGLGDNFAAFMHLADHDENLVTSRIWTEPKHIEAQLADLTEHMETVIQKYLRSQFESIEDYNEAAGEVAEPYRVLVIANFPVNFTPVAVRRLVSIVESGASCGVHTLISADVRQPMPQGFEIDELTSQCLSLRWQGSRFLYNDPELDQFPLTLETPPENGQLIEIVRRVGAASKAARRVEVPFSHITPAPEDVWKADSRRGISVPLGRAGAVRKLMLQLGKGTSQHMLIAGKTGSGKSTLWHALIVNLALHYSPDELELYLIDFKKGVEFKVYAEAHLPHARVIAIESEREFGLSVLQKLDALLRERGDLFRTAGVNDIASYREARPDEVCPRVLFIVDEFQEFFVEDDKLSQEAALLLDRLVRQGRAFGLHVLLGSQTLGGVYSLARSTIDQMAVRIALQCSEADAQLILNKDNSAARLLSRPGEAIFNDAGGALEGNEIFQVVWLNEDERDRIVRSLYERAMTTTLRSRPQTIVFESSIPARLEDNALLERRQDVPRAWLGEAIAIKDPTAAVFRMQTGANLMIVGQHEEAALALLASSFVSLAAQHAPGTARFWFLDGLSPEEPFESYMPQLVEGWPHPVQRVERTELASVTASLAEEVQRRLKGTGERDRCYFLIHGVQRYREFRKGDDDFGFGRRGAERTVSPSEHLTTILRDGPTVGVHVLFWCDQLTNLNRVLDRQGQRECGLRVLFQMSAADSSHLLDSPMASKLGRNRALYFHDEMSQPEKFRPYDLPSLAWLRELRNRAGVEVALR